VGLAADGAGCRRSALDIDRLARAVANCRPHGRDTRLLNRSNLFSLFEKSERRDLKRKLFELVHTNNELEACEKREPARSLEIIDRYRCMQIYTWEISSLHSKLEFDRKFKSSGDGNH
jgi:hypothetical protein